MKNRGDAVLASGRKADKAVTDVGVLIDGGIDRAEVQLHGVEEQSNLKQVHHHNDCDVGCLRLHSFNKAATSTAVAAPKQPTTERRQSTKQRRLPSGGRSSAASAQQSGAKKVSLESVQASSAQAAYAQSAYCFSPLCADDQTASNRTKVIPVAAPKAQQRQSRAQSATVQSAAVQSAAVQSAAVQSATVQSAAVQSTTVKTNAVATARPPSVVHCCCRHRCDNEQMAPPTQSRSTYCDISLRVQCFPAPAAAPPKPQQLQTCEQQQSFEQRQSCEVQQLVYSSKDLSTAVSPIEKTAENAIGTAQSETTVSTNEESSVYCFGQLCEGNQTTAVMGCLSSVKKTVEKQITECEVECVKVAVNVGDTACKPPIQVFYNGELVIDTKRRQ